MKRNHSRLWIAGWAGIAGGALLTVIGVVATDELSRLAGGYGLMIMGAAAYLLAGLGLRDTLVRRAKSVQVSSQALSHTGLSSNQP
jgi:hypothetical protein